MFPLIAVGLLVVFFLGGSALKSNYPDIDPNKQGGTFKKDYDFFFKHAADSAGVPFALVKAHAIAESSLNPLAFTDESNTGSNRDGWASRGLMQVLWWPDSDRFEKYGFPDDMLEEGELLHDPNTNTLIGACIIRDNLARFKNVRDAINAYNTGKSEADHPAPNNYVNKVIGYYKQLTGDNTL